MEDMHIPIDEGHTEFHKAILSSMDALFFTSCPEGLVRRFTEEKYRHCTQTFHLDSEVNKILS